MRKSRVFAGPQDDAQKVAKNAPKSNGLQSPRGAQSQKMHDRRRKGVAQIEDTKKTPRFRCISATFVSPSKRAPFVRFFGVHSGRQVRNPFAPPVMHFLALGSTWGVQSMHAGAVFCCFLNFFLPHGKNAPFATENGSIRTDRGVHSRRVCPPVPHCTA